MKMHVHDRVLSGQVLKVRLFEYNSIDLISHKRSQLEQTVLGIVYILYGEGNKAVFLSPKHESMKKILKYFVFSCFRVSVIIFSPRKSTTFINTESRFTYLYRLP